MPRAELFALTLVCSRVCEGAEVDYIMDSEVNVKHFYKGRKRSIQTTNGDLFLHLHNLISAKNITLNLHWVPSHVEEGKKPVKSNVPFVFLLANMAETCQYKYLIGAVI